VEKQKLVSSINLFFLQLPVGLRHNAFVYSDSQGVREEFASLGYQLRYLIGKLGSELSRECDRLLREHERVQRKAVP
jgi:hypothetical protein